MLFRRRRPDPELDRIRAAFGRLAVEVDAAQRALLAAIPTARDPGVPLAQALAAFGDRLERAALAMPAWRDDRLRDEHDRCAAALDEARSEADALRLEPDDLGFEQLNVRIGDVLHPLEVFADVERDLRRPRR